MSRIKGPAVSRPTAVPRPTTTAKHTPCQSTLPPTRFRLWELHLQVEYRRGGVQLAAIRRVFGRTPPYTGDQRSVIMFDKNADGIRFPGTAPSTGPFRGAGTTINTSIKFGPINTSVRFDPPGQRLQRSPGHSGSSAQSCANDSRPSTTLLPQKEVDVKQDPLPLS